MKNKIKKTETHYIYPLWYNGENTWNWTKEDILKAMKNEPSEKQLNHINNKKNEKQKK
jgi:hypothetical protein